MDHVKLLILFLLICSVISCSHPTPIVKPSQNKAASQSVLFNPVNLNPRIQQLRLKQKIDNLIIIRDTIGQSTATARLSKEVVNRMNLTLREIKLNLAINTITSQKQSSAEENNPNRINTLSAAIVEVASILPEMKGKTAIIILTRWELIDQSAIHEAKRLRIRFGDKICIHTIGVGNQFACFKMMQLGHCGLSVSSASIWSATDMATFVERVFFERSFEQFQPTAENGSGGPFGSQNKRITSENSISGNDAQVIFPSLLFDTGLWTIKPNGYAVLNKAISVLNHNPDLMLRIDGHTDNMGTYDDNMMLSGKRAKAVKKFLEQQGIDARRLMVNAFSYSIPVASNETADGRALNRRAEIRIVY